MFIKYDWIFLLFIVGLIYIREIEWVVWDLFLKDVILEGIKIKFIKMLIFNIVCLFFVLNFGRGV